MTNQKTKIWILICVFAVCSLQFAVSVFAQDSGKLVALTKQIMDAKTSEDLYLTFEELTVLYFKENKYNEFVAYLNSLAKQKKELEAAVDYYIALTRHYQLKYLEDNQKWDEYFTEGNSYREEITSYLDKAIKALGPSDPLSLFSRLVLWEYHKNAQDDQVQAALTELTNAVLAYAEGAKNLEPIKGVADHLLGMGEKNKAREVYKIFLNKLGASAVSADQLKNAASLFYQEGNLDLAEMAYEIYLERLLKQEEREKFMAAAVEIANLFAFKDGAANDPIYAEKIFQKLDFAVGKEAFNEELTYMRAFNLEKAKEYRQAKNIYLELLQRFPQTAHADEALYKISIIYTYIARDLKNGRENFSQLAQKEAVSPQVISGLYQLGLLSQWEADNVKAKEYYSKLIERAQGGYPETIALANERLKEIEEGRPIEYNLRTFLDVSLKEEHAALDMTKVNIKASVYILNKDEKENITSIVIAPESGCLQQEVRYLWSGHLGDAKPTLNDPSFTTKYQHAGTKEINLVVVSASGFLDYNLDLVDVN